MITREQIIRAVESTSGNPETLAGFKGAHEGETIIVCGCGESLNELAQPERFVTIGVNDVGRRFQPTYLVVVNPRNQFSGDRFRYVETSQARYLFTQLDLGAPHPRVIKFRLGKYGGTDCSDPNTLHYTQNSPYVALCLAAHMGAKRIGLIGVDFTDNHFFAKTGAHALSRQLATINEEYRRLGEAMRARGVEVFNLSPASRLTAFPKIPVSEFAAAPAESAKEDVHQSVRVFGVNYRFLACGDVFSAGLRNGAGKLGLTYDSAMWDDAALPAKVERFRPDVLFVTHGRRFAQKWGNTFNRYNTAVWLLDEPYEVDDTSRWSGVFRTVFVNDPSTISRHRNAHYLPVCFDPQTHRDENSPRAHQVGFIGGGNETRERLLGELAEAGLLSYVVGGPWKSPALRSLSLGPNIPHEKTAELYQQTQIIVNVFRDLHHFNRRRVSARSMNPRIYEALACGALPLSEERPEIADVFPDLPTFDGPDSMIVMLKRLLSDERYRLELLEKNRARLAGHSYLDRLAEVLRVCVGTASSAALGQRIEKEIELGALALSSTGEQEPTYGIIMVVHNALAIAQMATLRTLRHIAGHSARLVIVDNASTDGAGEWLRTLADRGDITLIRSDRNIGHGPGIELARRSIRSPYLVTLDSDAFPLSDDWLPQLRQRLQGSVKVTGIRHHRDYIHPSCLMIARKTLEEFGLDFLDEKNKPSKLDVAEPISRELKRRGYQIAGLDRTGAQRRGSLSEPIYLGSNYEDLVYHQWYTTRAATSAGGPVDDAPRHEIERSLSEALEDYQAEEREITVVMGVRAAPDEPQRRRNAEACLRALNLQSLERWRYRVVVVEQDSAPRLEASLAPLADRYLFVHNTGPYNRGWAFNVGAVAAAGRRGFLCLIDADLLVDADFLARVLAAIRSGRRAARPYSEVAYLDSAATEWAIADRFATPIGRFEPQNYRGRLFTDSQGGCIWVDAALYLEMGGHDERFRGWGFEDREFWNRLASIASIERLPGRLLHLDHPQPAMNDKWAIANSRLHHQIARTGAVGDARKIGDPDLYTAEGAPGRREWENWHKWERGRIERIVSDERALPASISARHRLAEIIVKMGDSLLDVGCGPGALWPRLEPYRPRFRWAGADVTQQMLAVARSLFPHTPVFRVDAASLPFDDGSFDVVLLRHLLEHLPPDLMRSALADAIRVARRAVVLDFNTLPTDNGTRRTKRVGDNFLETQWTVADLEAPIAQAGWSATDRLTITGRPGEVDAVWVLAPARSAASLSNSDAPVAPAETIKLSIIMPTYRRAHTIFRTIGAIRAQTYSNWELIVIDNAGDGDYSFDDPRIRVYPDSGRISASYARNQGIKYATGDLVCFFDDDDDMFPNYVERLVATFQSHPNAKMVRCGMFLSNDNVNYSYATLECCLRREFVTPTWLNDGKTQDQRYFQRIIALHRWSEKEGDIVVLREALCRANTDQRGGLRSGNL